MAGVSFFDPGTKGVPLTWAEGAVNYYTDQGDLTMGVQYRDRCTRTDAGWLISARETVKLWSRGSFPQ